LDLNVLVIDDQPAILESMGMFFRLRGWEVYSARSGVEGLSLAKKFKPSVVILDIRLPDLNGLEVLEALRNSLPKAHVIMITAYQDMESTIQAIKLGAFDYLHKPIDIKEMETAIRRLEQVTMADIMIDEDLSGYTVSEIGDIPYIVGKSWGMKEVFKAIAVLSESRVTALIQGESGTGKELIARAIHYNSRWRNEPFTVMDCSTFVDSLMESELFGYEKGAFTGATETRKGRLELTGDGTIFFDEISELPLKLQSKLLRFLQEREFVRVGGNHPILTNARIIAATNRNLMDMVNQKTFRKDLYFRFKVITIDVPSLRERRSDILVLATYLAKKIASQSGLAIKGFSREAIHKLMEYSWPGNVRELENTLTRSFIMSKTDILTKDDIVFSFQKFDEERRNPFKDLEALEEVEKLHILRVLEACLWHFGEACKILAISRPTLRAKIKKYGLSANA
jgi:two-component system, NtrC family, response regulator AtoC